MSCAIKTDNQSLSPGWPFLRGPAGESRITEQANKHMTNDYLAVSCHQLRPQIKQICSVNALGALGADPATQKDILGTKLNYYL